MKWQKSNSRCLCWMWQLCSCLGHCSTLHFYVCIGLWPGPSVLKSQWEKKGLPIPLIKFTFHGCSSDIFPTISLWFCLSLSSNFSAREKVIEVATPKQHPYASHISQFAMFPSFRSPDDTQTGFRASRRPFPNALVPISAPDIILVSKTKGRAALSHWQCVKEVKLEVNNCFLAGNPYRHEVLQSPASSRRKGLIWCGQHGFYEVGNIEQRSSFQHLWACQ